MAFTGLRPGSRNSEVLNWLMEHPGLHAPQDVGLALQCTTHQAATTLNALMRRNLVERVDKQYRATGIAT